MITTPDTFSDCRIGVNALVFKNPLTGVAKRILYMYGELHRFYPQVVVYFFSPYPLNLDSLESFRSYGIDFSQSKFKMVVTPTGGWLQWIPGIKEVTEWWWLHFRLPWLMHDHHIRIYEAPWSGGIPFNFFYRWARVILGWFGRKFSKPVMILTIHDLIPLTFSKLKKPQNPFLRLLRIGIKRFSYFQSFFYRLRMTRNLQAADKIIAVSPQVREDILKHFSHISVQTKINVIANGVSPVKFLSQKSKSTKEFCWTQIEKKGVANSATHKPSLHKFLFYLGGFNPRKNLVHFLTAYRNCGHEASLAGYALVLAGQENHYFRKVLYPLIKDHPLPIVYLGYLSEKDLPHFYREAALVCYPSLAEGFGMPPLEALSQGGRVLIDNNLPINCGGENKKSTTSADKSFVITTLKKTFKNHHQDINKWWEQNVFTANGLDEQDLSTTILQAVSSFNQNPASLSSNYKEKIFSIWKNKHCPFHWNNLAKDYGKLLSQYL